MGGLQQLHMQVAPPYWEGGRLATRSGTGLIRLGRLSAQSKAVRAALTARAARRAVVHRHEPCPTPTVSQPAPRELQPQSEARSFAKTTRLVLGCRMAVGAGSLVAVG